MRILNVFKKKSIYILFFASLNFYMPAALAITLNFSAILAEATCTISLDKNVLSLGDISQSQLKANKIVAAQPFQLNIQNCISISGSAAYSILVSGSGSLVDGKWLFRNSDEIGHGTGIMLVQSNTVPDYLNSEIRDGSAISIGGAGITPTDQSLKFYAGVSCGSDNGCATMTPGKVSATVMFDLVYR